MRTFRPLLQQARDILGNDAKDRGAERLLHVINGLHARIQVLDEERQSDPEQQPGDGPEGDVQALAGPDRPHAGLTGVNDLDAGLLGDGGVDVLLGQLECHRLPHADHGVQILLLPHVGPVFLDGFRLITLRPFQLLGNRHPRGHVSFELGLHRRQRSRNDIVQLTVDGRELTLDFLHLGVFFTQLRVKDRLALLRHGQIAQQGPELGCRPEQVQRIAQLLHTCLLCEFLEQFLLLGDAGHQLRLGGHQPARLVNRDGLERATAFRKTVRNTEFNPQRVHLLLALGHLGVEIGQLVGQRGQPAVIATPAEAFAVFLIAPGNRIDDVGGELTVRVGGRNLDDAGIAVLLDVSSLLRIS